MRTILVFCIVLLFTVPVYAASPILDLTIVLDESGSMEPLRDDIIGGVNRVIRDQFENDPNAVVTIVKFSTTSAPLFVGEPIGMVQPLTRSTYHPGGGTALLDAMYDAIEAADERIGKLPESERPKKAVLVVFTDGKENSSRRRSNAEVVKLVSHYDKSHHWEFVYMGAGIDAFDQARTIGISEDRALYFDSTPGNITTSTGALSDNLRGLITDESGTGSMIWSSEQRKAFKP